MLICIIVFFHFKYGIGDQTIVITAQGCTCPSWKTATGANKIRNSILSNGFSLDSIVNYEFNSTGLEVDSLLENDPYDDYLITYEFDGITFNVNGEKKYCPILKIIKWQHIGVFTNALMYVIPVMILLLWLSSIKKRKT